jgi:hypothetical protein
VNIIRAVKNFKQKEENIFIFYSLRVPIRARRVDPDPDPVGSASKNFGYDELYLEVKFHYNLMIMKIIIKIT